LIQSILILFLVFAKSFYLAVKAYNVFLVKTKKNDVSDGIPNGPASSDPSTGAY
jgi:hypothetical protein